MIVDDPEGIRRILGSVKRIAVVGLSPRRERPSYGVAAFLQQQGYTIVPVNPAEREILGETCYPDLASIPGPVDMVDVFRRAEDVPPIAAEAERVGARVLWLQLGVIHPEAAQQASDAGLEVVMDRCPKIEYPRLMAR